MQTTFSEVHRQPTTRRPLLNGESMRSLLCLIALTVATGVWSQSSQPTNNTVLPKQMFAGTWWLKSDAEERAGLLNGVADCMTWTAHEKGFNATPEQLTGRVSKFYASHPEAATLSVIDVWRKLDDRPQPSTGTKGQGETWKNAHWYLNGDWWAQISEDQQLGFVEGYLWCLRTQVPAPTDGYSASPDTYRRKIDAFVKANPKLGKEAVAVTLRRYRDQDAAASHQ